MRYGFFSFLLLLIATGVFLAAWSLSSIDLEPLQVTINDTVRLVPVNSLFMAALLLVALSSAVTIIVFVLGNIPMTINRWLTGRQREQGMAALGKGMLAIAAGDTNQAIAFSQKANRLLGDNNKPMTMLLAAQARQLNGEDTAAAAYFKAMTDNQETAFLGYRGQIMQALKTGDEDTALALAKKAHAVNAYAPWVVDVLYHLQARNGYHEDAEEITRETARKNLLPAIETDKRLVVLKTQRAFDHFNKGDIDTALKLSGEVLSKDPACLPAAMVRVQSLLAKDKKRRAARLMRTIWQTIPQPDLVSLFCQSKNADTDESKRQAIRALAKSNPQHPLSFLVQSEAAVKAHDFAAGKEMAARAIEAGSGQRAEAINRFCQRAIREQEDYEAAMAKHEQALDQYMNGKSDVSLDEAPDKPVFAEAIQTVLSIAYDESWCCECCGSRQPDWLSRCNDCRSVGTITWRKPDFHVSQTHIELTGNRALVSRNPLVTGP